jgi:hypothetical protein
MRKTRDPWILASLLLVALLAPVPLLTAGAPEPPAQQVAAPLPVSYEGQQALVVRIPEGVSLGEATAVVQQAQDNMQHVANDEVNLPEATRDVEETVDLGGHLLFVVIGMLVGSVFRPITDLIVTRSKLDNRLTGAINVLVLVVVYVGAWALCHDAFPELPQQPLGWVVMALGASGVGAGTQSYVRSRKEGASAEHL